MRVMNLATLKDGRQVELKTRVDGQGKVCKLYYYANGVNEIELSKDDIVVVKVEPYDDAD